jgi:catechol 2,3-dioxygenase-like lactoylglutathione lyase family enzyme
MNPFSSVVVGVADLERALALWTDRFGLALAARSDGPDAELARLWGIAPADIRRQALVATPGRRLGMIHLVEFENPDPPVRHDAAMTDCCPKNLDVYADDLPGKMRELTARGYNFRNPTHSEVETPDGLRFREGHMPAHDDINVVLLELVGQDLPYSASGFAAVGLLITIVPDAERERDFYRTMLELEILHDNVLQGPEVEAMIGLPPGVALHASVWGQPDEPMGQIEVIEYRGAAGDNLFPRARPKALGVLHVSFESPNVTSLRQRLAAAGIAFAEHGQTSTLATTGDTISFLTPAGMRIEATGTG